jgi:hypothetical protein
VDDEELASEEEETIAEFRAFVEEIRFKNAEIPIFLHGETRTSRHIPNDILRELHGFIHMHEDTPEFIARHVVREARAYLDSLPPPFFRALTQYAADGSYSCHCPDHSGGVAFLKSPVGQMFHQFFGENMLRADVCNAVEELGQLLDHTGPVAASERNAARIFNGDHLFFVTNGTSTSNRIVWHSTVAPGDIVVVDRNCHKSILHANRTLSQFRDGHPRLGEGGRQRQPWVLRGLREELGGRFLQPGAFAQERFCAFQTIRGRFRCVVWRHPICGARVEAIECGLVVADTRSMLSEPFAMSFQSLRIGRSFQTLRFGNQRIRIAL